MEHTSQEEGWKMRETRKLSEPAPVDPKRWDTREHKFQKALNERDATRATRIRRDAAEDLLQKEGAKGRRRSDTPKPTTVNACKRNLGAIQNAQEREIRRMAG